MTFSIVARSSDGLSWGVATASKVAAVGAMVPAASAGVGAIATQSLVNVGYKPAALSLLGDGATADETLQRLLETDEGRDLRQVGIVDRDGHAVTYTGPGCIGWAGGVRGDGYAIQGNILVGEAVVLAMQSAFLAVDAGAPLSVRLLAAVRAGDEAGGDARGRQSAALLVKRDGAGILGLDDMEFDLRVDDHVDPVGELHRLHEVFHQLRTGDAVPEDERTPESPELWEEMESRARALGHSSFVVWIGVNDYEKYCGEDWLGNRVVEDLRAATPGWTPAG